MVKVKNKKGLNSDKVNSVKDAKSQGMNPFEVHINRQKQKVLGQKLKNDRGLPGVSRAKALQRRKKTLLQEYNVQNKTNKFVDKRIGEKNREMTFEDRQMARFTAERIKTHNKKSIYNLADEEVLTHKGQTLTEIEKFDDPRSDDDDEDFDEHGNKKSGKLEDNFVEDAHFGGGILKKSGSDVKSHKDLIEQLIAESKKRKAEKQKIKEETVELTEKLDSEWKDLLPIVSQSKRTDQDEDLKTATDSYDRAMRELRFEARGNPTDRLKSEEEIAKEEKEKLDKLEQDRINRMRGDEEIAKNDKARKHRSADDLDDNFAADSDSEEVIIAYDQEGNLIKNFAKNGDNFEESNLEMENFEGGDDLSGNEEEENDESESESESDDLSDLKNSETESSDEEIESPNSKVETPQPKVETKLPQSKSRKKSITEDILDTIPISDQIPIEKDSKIEKNSLKTDKTPQAETPKTLKRKLEKSSEPEEIEEKISKNVVDELLERQKLRDEAAKELPYTYTVPESYEELEKLFSDKTAAQQSIILERMIKCNNPNLANGNKVAISRLFAYLLQHLNDISTNENCFKITTNIMPQLFDIAQLNKEGAHEALIQVLKEKYQEYNEKSKNYPGIEVLLFLNVVSCLFPTSDFRHQVCTPAVVFISQILTNVRPKSKSDICFGLYLVTLVLEFTALSKRFVPAAINYLAGILHMAIPKTGVQLIKVTPPFKPLSTNLVLTEKIKNFDENEVKMESIDFFTEEIDNKFKIKVLYNTVNILQEFYERYIGLPSWAEILTPHIKFLEKIHLDFYPENVRTSIENIVSKISKSMENRKLEYLKIAAKKPKALRLYEPSFIKIVDGKHRKEMSKEKAEKSKLLHKYKKEMKGALREIRRDKSFLGSVKIKQKMQTDFERKEKVKQIYREASIQQSELKAIDRKKKRK